MQYKSLSVSPYDRDDIILSDGRYNGFFILSILKVDTHFEIWLRHAAYGIAVLLHGLPCSEYPTLFDVQDHVAKYDFDDDIKFYAEQYLDDIDIYDNDIVE